MPVDEWASAACLFAGICASGAASGGELNPALCAGMVSEDIAYRGADADVSSFFTFSAWEFLGGLLAACAVRASHEGQPLEKAPLLSK
ncbi:unnamed protein product [Prorocentrum cordatum]|uniref:Aquaporin n=1 Tax=Prorocentrum cordatum TaxID=2364126 RepID=A0ABN9SSA9_9DINO|nr:unnamed protein product [Polarella glacialis]